MSFSELRKILFFPCSLTSEFLACSKNANGPSVFVISALPALKVIPFQKDFTTDYTDFTDRGKDTFQEFIPFPSVKSVKSVVQFRWLWLCRAVNLADKFPFPIPICVYLWLKRAHLIFC